MTLPEYEYEFYANSYCNELKPGACLLTSTTFLCEIRHLDYDPPDNYNANESIGIFVDLAVRFCASSTWHAGDAWEGAGAVACCCRRAGCAGHRPCRGLFVGGGTRVRVWWLVVRPDAGGGQCTSTSLIWGVCSDVASSAARVRGVVIVVCVLR